MINSVSVGTYLVHYEIYLTSTKGKKNKSFRSGTVITMEVSFAKDLWGLEVSIMF